MAWQRVFVVSDTGTSGRLTELAFVREVMSAQASKQQAGVWNADGW
ncbi:MAG: hypothetical protein KDA86_24425 [Planctomycetaceae bacterium]|nr:hypothetical protein [Planctomycetaceae bacterium]